MNARKLVLLSLVWELAACKVAMFPMHEPLYPAASERVDLSLTVDTDAAVQTIRLYERVATVDENGVVDRGVEELIAQFPPGSSNPFTVTHTVWGGYPANRLVSYRFEVDRYLLPSVSHRITFAIRPYPVVWTSENLPVPAPVYCQGSVRTSIDVVFVPDEDLITLDPYDDNFTEFRSQCKKMIEEAMWHDPTLKCWRRSFNYYMNPLTGDAVALPAGPYGPHHEPPANKATLSFAEVKALLHETEFVDWMLESEQLLSAELDSRWTFLHELGHRAFGLGDEQPNGWHEPTPNLWPTYDDAAAAAPSRGKAATDARLVDPWYTPPELPWYKLCEDACQMNATANAKVASTFDSPCARGIDAVMRKLLPTFPWVVTSWIFSGADACPWSGVPFDPEYFKPMQHYVFVLTLDRGDLLPTPVPLEIQPGPPPYQAPTGSVTFRALNASGTELYRRQIRDPRFRQPDGPLELLLPADERIARLELGPLDGHTYTFDVKSSVQGAIQR